MYSHPGDNFLSCDWGTTSFRLRWIFQGTVVQEYSDCAGCKGIFTATSDDPTARTDAFERQVRKALSTFRDLPSEIPLVISGMASSTIGWRELPYAPLPLYLDGTNLHVESLVWRQPIVVSRTYLISGAACENEMMRGEETEAIGLLTSIASPTDGLLILPGTHSKQLSISSGQITRIQTFMTGELYELLTTYSVLRASVNICSAQDYDSFCEGIDCVLEHSLSSALFQTRTRQVLKRKSSESNASFLSGVLIGSELHHLKSLDKPILIAGVDSVRTLYSRAAEHLRLPAKAFTSEQVRLAVPRAHQIVLSRLAAK